MIKKVALGLVVIVAHFAAYAQEETPTDDAVRVVKAHTDLVINSDATATLQAELAVSPTKQAAINALGQQIIPYQEGMEELEVLEAYTLKQDGRRIDVPADRIVTQVPPAFADTSLYNDMKVKRIVFSDLAVGDQIVYKIKKKIVIPQIPGQFFNSFLFAKSVRYDDVVITLKHPKTFALQFHNRGLTEQAPQSKGGFILHEWRYKNDVAVPEEPDAVNPYDRDPILEVSSFKSWADVAKAYDARAKDKAVVTPEIKKLADDVTKDIVDKRKQAEALYGWVAKNIRYVAIYLGAGGFVPHAADAVLTNRYGDCKDHVAILEALLKAKGIDSEPILISASNRFTLPGIPTLAFNHAITYLPEYKLYVDATARTLPFGMLAASEAGKPVVHTRYFKEMVTTPSIAPSTQSLVSTFSAVVADDGTLKGSGQTSATGPIRASVQSLIEQLDRPFVIKQIATRLLTRDQLTGTGSLAKAEDGATTTSYKSEFSTSNWINVPGPGAMKLPTSIMALTSLQTIAVNTLNRSAPKVDRVCPPMDIEESSTLQLTDKIKVTNIPKNIDATSAIASYHSSYERDGNTIKVSRKLHMNFLNPVCKPEQIAAYREIIEQVRRDTSAQMTYE